jgi:hypothetical protein
MGASTPNGLETWSLNGSRVSPNWAWPLGPWFVPCSLLGQIRILFYFGYPLVTRGRKAIPVPVSAKPRVGYEYYLWVKFRAHARTRRIGYPQIPILTDKIAIPRPNQLRMFEIFVSKVIFYFKV